IVNDRAASYVQDLQIAIETDVRISRTRERTDVELAQGAIHVLRADLVDAATRALLKSVARITLVARDGTIAAQLERLRRKPLAASPAGKLAVRKQALYRQAPPPAADRIRQG